MTTNKKKSVQRCIYLPSLLDEQMKDYCERTGLPVSYVIKTALKMYFDSLQKQ